MNERPEVVDPREQRLNDVLGAYLEAEDAGWAPDRAGLLTRYPEFKSDLEAFFVAQSRVAALAYPCPPSAQRQGKDADAAGKDDAPTRGLADRNGADAGRSVGDYELAEAVLGAGGMGTVYKARLKWTDSWVALKKIKAGRLASRSEVRRFLDEVRAAASLHHPNIVPIYHVGEDRGQPYFTMKLFEEGSLQQHLPRFEANHRAAARLLAQAARAVHHAHRHGILHRDLKPANILLDAQGQPHVADFGLAKQLGKARADAPRLETAPASKPATPMGREPKTDPDAEIDVRYLAPEQTGPTQGLDQASPTPDQTVTEAKPNGATRVGAFLGTRGYVPPEHADVSKEGTSTAADVYSLGAILYRIMTGKTLFESAPTLADAVRQVKECEPAPPRTLKPKTDRRLEAICLKCLQKDPGQRYASAELLAEDLERWLRGEPPLAWPVPWRLRVWRAVRRHLFVALSAICLGFAAAAIFFVYYYFNPERVPHGLEQEARERAVKLIGETGPPKWSQWNVGAGATMVGADADGPFFMTTLEDARLDLLRQAPPRYRFSAEVRHDQVFDPGWVGIYFARAERAIKEDRKQYWWDVSFADRGKLALQSNDAHPQAVHGIVELSGRRFGLPEGTFRRLTEVRKLFVSANGAREAKSPWRKLAVEVTGEKIRWFWEGEVLGELSQAGVRKLGEARKLGDTDFPEIEFKPEGALGIHVRRGKASFRNVTIEPLE